MKKTPRKTIAVKVGMNIETRAEERLGFEFYADLLAVFLDLLKENFGERLISLVLYGSVARGEASRTSDIDLLIILDDISPNYHHRLDEILKVQTRLEQGDVYKATKEAIGIDPFLSYLLFSKEEADENRYIYLDMVEDARTLYDRDAFFARRLKKMKERLKELGSKRIQLKDGTWYWDIKPDLKSGEVFTL